MPANRPERSRDEKAAELVAIAQRLFLERGYRGTTMAAIAAEAGVASNVVHWYFASKDELFAVALEGLQIATLDWLEREFRAAAGAADGAKALEALLTRLVRRLVQAHALITAVHERANHSPVVADFHERAHARYGEFLQRVVGQCGAPEEELDLIVNALLAVVEGLVMHRTDEAETRRMIAFLTDRLVPHAQEEPR